MHQKNRLIARFGGDSKRVSDALYVSLRASQHWLSGDRKIPGPVLAALDLADKIPERMLPELWKKNSKKKRDES